MKRRHRVEPWAYFCLALGAVTSVAGNVADAYVTPKDWHPAFRGDHWTPEIGAVLWAVFWPLALIGSSELLARKRFANPVTRRIVVGAVLVVAVVAAVISYGHLHSLLHHYRETNLAALIGPIGVDGLMVASSIVLIAADGAAEHVDDDQQADASQGVDEPQAADLEPARHADAPDGHAEGGDTDAEPAPAQPPAQKPTPRRTPSAPRARSRALRSADQDILLPVAREVAREIAATGGRVTRDALRDGIRERGHTCANARAGHLLGVIQKPARKAVG